ncbi:sporulation protein YtxC [Pontibacillus salicampi]|uniref:Sporulation protein YtxC n=1 Tax=Pontibacillus salicampi TaxID=1449801 RepID=A0ABV6LIZ6_9BACI
MREVCFEQKREALAFCDFMMNSSLEATVRWNYTKKWGHSVHIECSQLDGQALVNKIVTGLIHVFTLHREHIWLHDIIRDCYYYQDEDEIGHILEVCRSFMEGEAGEHVLNGKISHKRLVMMLSRVLENAIQEQKDRLHFDSVITFRLQLYYEDLIEFVGTAIDEYKREEEYQNYVEQLREYLQTKRPRLDQLHVVQKDGAFRFFGEEGKPLTKNMIKELAKQEPLFVFGLGQEELNLTPIMALAPKRISIYGSDVADPKTLTVMNVFQERASMYSIHQFPYKELLST